MWFSNRQLYIGIAWTLWLSVTCCGPGYALSELERGMPGFYTGVFNRWEHRWSDSFDIDGEVGYRLKVDGFRGTCLPSNNWSVSYHVISGTLPPGLNWNVPAHGDISGIPRKRGNWIVRVAIDSIVCNGVEVLNRFWGPYKIRDLLAKPVEIRFHIKG